MTARQSATETEIPLYLIPTAIARQINMWGEEVYRISVKRIHWHHYNITVRTKSLKRELRIRNERVMPFANDPVDDMNSNGNSGGAT